MYYLHASAIQPAFIIRSMKYGQAQPSRIECTPGAHNDSVFYLLGYVERCGAAHKTVWFAPIHFWSELCANMTKVKLYSQFDGHDENHIQILNSCKWLLWRRSGVWAVKCIGVEQNILPKCDFYDRNVCCIVTIYLVRQQQENLFYSDYLFSYTTHTRAF